ncbi:hypothetical protein DNTS_001901 [Danionella cerebrum]|uniref:Uncharacterized protein n=1 Tax=Danionella cerebrum TaxID=2873325 RepID=A0A553RKG9_9TELE|nr:hypothetical protein DNTS_001901 [Danionella translucida]
MSERETKTSQDLTVVMSTRIDDLEKNISDLMTQAGVEELDEDIKTAKEHHEDFLLQFANF